MKCVNPVVTADALYAIDVMNSPGIGSFDATAIG